MLRSKVVVLMLPCLCVMERAFEDSIGNVCSFDSTEFVFNHERFVVL